MPDMRWMCGARGCDRGLYHYLRNWSVSWLGRLLGGASSLLLASCNQPTEKARDVKLFQQWQLQPGDWVAKRRLAGGLGDLSIELNGNSVYAPFEGKVQPTTKGDCVVFSSPEVPGYLFRLCGLDHPKTGPLRKGEKIGAGAMLQFAALRQQPNDTWAIVEPSKKILEQTLSQLDQS